MVERIARRICTWLSLHVGIVIVSYNTILWPAGTGAAVIINTAILLEFPTFSGSTYSVILDHVAIPGPWITVRFEFRTGCNVTWVTVSPGSTASTLSAWESYSRWYARQIGRKSHETCPRHADWGNHDKPLNDSCSSFKSGRPPSPRTDSRVFLSGCQPNRNSDSTI